MTYSPTTLNLVVQGIGGANKIWQYTNTDGASSVDASGYISNATQAGVTAGDLVISQDTDDSAKITSGHVVVAITSGTADLSNGTTIAGASNSD